MKRTSIFLSILTLSVLILSACGPTVDEAKSDFCSDLNELDAAVNSLRSVTSLNDVKQAGEDIGDAWDQVVKSGESLEDVQLDATREAYEEMVSAIEDAPSSGSLSGALGSVGQAVTNFAVSLQEIYSTACSDG